MPDEPDNIVLEHLRHIRRIVDKVETDVTELKSPITSFEARWDMSWFKSDIYRHRSPIRRGASIASRVVSIELSRGWT
jgi:hypothetical protein